jgi:hypothetical protein
MRVRLSTFQLLIVWLVLAIVTFLVVAYFFPVHAQGAPAPGGDVIGHWNELAALEPARSKLWIERMTAAKALQRSLIEFPPARVVVNERAELYRAIYDAQLEDERISAEQRRHLAKAYRAEYGRDLVTKGDRP